MKVMLRGVAVLLATCQALGCASMIHGNSDEIHIQTGDPKAEVYVDNERIGTGMGDAVVHRDRTYKIEVREAGCETRTVQTGSKFDTATLVPLAFYIVPIIPGLIVDSLTGDMWETYPMIYTLAPVCPPPKSVS
jgi:hypothetical protein